MSSRPRKQGGGPRGIRRSPAAQTRGHCSFTALVRPKSAVIPTRRNTMIRKLIKLRWPLLLAVLVTLLVSWAVWRQARHDSFSYVPEDPRLTFGTPYRSVRPEVKYVGSAQCASCHPDQAASYRQHPMGRSLAPVGEASALESFG